MWTCSGGTTSASPTCTRIWRASSGSSPNCVPTWPDGRRSHSSAGAAAGAGAARACRTQRRHRTPARARPLPTQRVASLFSERGVVVHVGIFLPPPACHVAPRGGGVGDASHAASVVPPSGRALVLPCRHTHTIPCAFASVGCRRCAGERNERGRLRDKLVRRGRPDRTETLRTRVIWRRAAALPLGVGHGTPVSGAAQSDLSITCEQVIKLWKI